MVERTYNKRVQQKSFKVGDLVWKAILPLGDKDPQLGKWSPNWEGPYVISKVLLRGAYHLANKDGEIHERSVNGKILKNYRPMLGM